MKDVELRLMSELLKNSRRSDRELAKAIGASQPAVSRAKAKLEKEGYIAEYTIVPNFKKLGYHLFAQTFLTLLAGASETESRRRGLEKLALVPNNVIWAERGMGLGYDAFMASFHRDFTSYTKLMDEIRAVSSFVDISKIESFIVDLDDEFHYRYLTLATLAKHVIETEKSARNTIG